MDTQVQIIKQVNDQDVMDSRDVAKMVGKTHKNLIRDIRRYINDLEEESKLSPQDFFIESNYESQQGKTLPCYLLTKQGCEFVANKLTGKKGTIFTATYVGLFNQYQEEHNGKLIGKDKNLTRDNLEFKREWLLEMKRQNDNKEHQLRNDDAKIWLELADRVDEYGETRMALDMRNDVIGMMTRLPISGQEEYSASQIGEKLGVSPLQIGKWGSILGIKSDRHLSYKTAEGAWRYYPKAVELFQKNQFEIQSDFLS